MGQYINKSALVAEIKNRRDSFYSLSKSCEKGTPEKAGFYAQAQTLEGILSFLDTLETNTLETKEEDFDNDGWIDCAKQMPPEVKQYSDTLQGHREWTESDLVLAWDSLYGCRVDATKNGKWMSEQRGGYTGQVVHGIIAWRPIPEFNEELL